jgi:GTPase
MEAVHGDIQGIRAVYLKQLQQLYAERQPADRLITPEFAQQLAQLSSDIRQPLCSYINRRGQIIRVAIGTPNQTQLAETDLPRQSADRLSGIRCIAILPQAPEPASLISMVRQRLDALVGLVLADDTGRRNRKTSTIQAAYLAHFAPDIQTPWSVSEPMSLAELAEQDFSDLIHDWESDFRAYGFGEIQFQGPSDRTSSTQHSSTQHSPTQHSLTQNSSTQPQPDRVLLVGLLTSDITPQRFEYGLEELLRLVETAGGEVVGTLRQTRSRPHPQTVVGQGKAAEIALQSQTLGANLVVFDRDMSAAQGRNLEDQIEVRVIDRTQLILDIFAQRAQSQSGKLQVELAQMAYLLPRLRGQGQSMSRLGGGIGTRGPGETKLETERRIIQRRIVQLQQEVTHLQAHRARQRQQRQHREIPTIALVGYTNAGKSTLLNVLTRAEVYVADQLFATLDPTTRRLKLTDTQTQERHDLLLTDTVGFIHELPPALIDAFRATLEEVGEADLLLHLVDLSHPAWESHIRSVESVLADLPALPELTLLVFNKIDRVDQEILTAIQHRYPQALMISAIAGSGLDTLRQQVLNLIYGNLLPTLLPDSERSLPD